MAPVAPPVSDAYVVDLDSCRILVSELYSQNNFAICDVGGSINYHHSTVPLFHSTIPHSIKSIHPILSIDLGFVTL